MDVVKVADHVVDLGPDGGEAGGHIIFSGTPEALAERDSATGRFLRMELERSARLAEAENGEDEEDVDLDELTSDDEDEPEEEPEEEEEGEPVP